MEKISYLNNSKSKFQKIEEINLKVDDKHHSQDSIDKAIR